MFWLRYAQWFNCRKGHLLRGTLIYLLNLIGLYLSFRKVFKNCLELNVRVKMVKRSYFSLFQFILYIFFWFNLSNNFISLNVCVIRHVNLCNLIFSDWHNIKGILLTQRFLVRFQSGMKISGTEFSALPCRHLRVWSRGNDDSPSEGDDKWLTRVKREPYLLHVKDTLVDFEKKQVNAATRQHSHPQSRKGLI